MKNDNEKRHWFRGKRSPSPSLFIFIWILVALGVLLQTFLPVLIHIRDDSLTIAGQFGDSFGFISSLMATLAAVGAWKAVEIQNEERAERDTQFREQVTLTRTQAFENTFYSLLAHHNTLVAGTDIWQRQRVSHDDGNVDYKYIHQHVGRDAFKRLLSTLRNALGRVKKTEDLDLIKSIYAKFYDKFEDDIGHYHRTLYHIVRFVDESDGIDKAFYIRLLRAQLSNSEQVLLLYNCSVGPGFEKFRPLIDKHALLHNIRLTNAGFAWERDILCPIFQKDAFREDPIT
ncbi:putative phage abortive infection protein [Sphingomonas profundi]|uniref:putative phage abortive infection protein n=1 Tax=Alterirhizorhabdus profundi TaxID=2681549 RepID=UPI001E456621|nr:putative phage abortive infection protein [Sphingomonas profundi]